MKLAEALQERADLNRNIEQLKNRLSSNALVQEGEQPVECPENLKQELDASISRLSYLIARINRTNCQTVVEGQTLTELIAQKDAPQTPCIPGCCVRGKSDILPRQKYGDQDPVCVLCGGLAKGDRPDVQRTAPAG